VVREVGEIPGLVREISSFEVDSSQGDYNGGVTSDLVHRENGRRFLMPLVCADCLLTGLEAACSGKSGGVRLRSARARARVGAKQAASNPVSRQPA